MSEERPLHVRVAEALGWSDCRQAYLDHERGNAGEWIGGVERRGAVDRPWWITMPVPRYDTDWAATGPLIGKYGIHIEPFYDFGNSPSAIPVDTDTLPYRWCAWTHQSGIDWKCDLSEVGETPLLAVCHLILALKEAGKLC